MSKYTTELRYICETLAGKKESEGQQSVAAIIAAARAQIFDFDYPIFDEAYRETLETKIIKHFYTREICEETYGLWKLRLNDKLNVSMPYFNLLYKSAALDFNPFYDIDVTRTHSASNVGEQSRKRDSASYSQSDRASASDNSGSISGASKDSSTESSNHWDLYADTPQGGTQGITGEYPNDSFDDNVYLTNARNIKDNRNVEAETNNTTISNEQRNQNERENTNAIGNTNEKTDVRNIEEYSERVIGKQGTQNYSELLLKFRKTFLNIDEMVLDSLNDLFFGLW